MNRIIFPELLEDARPGDRFGDNPEIVLRDALVPGRDKEGQVYGVVFTGKGTLQRWPPWEWKTYWYKVISIRWDSEWKEVLVGTDGPCPLCNAYCIRLLTRPCLECVKKAKDKAKLEDAFSDATRPANRRIDAFGRIDGVDKYWEKWQSYHSLVEAQVKLEALIQLKKGDSRHA